MFSGRLRGVLFAGVSCLMGMLLAGCMHQTCDCLDGYYAVVVLPVGAPCPAPVVDLSPLPPSPIRRGGLGGEVCACKPCRPRCRLGEKLRCLFDRLRCRRIECCEICSEPMTHVVESPQGPEGITNMPQLREEPEAPAEVAITPAPELHTPPAPGAPAPRRPVALLLEAFDLSDPVAVGEETEYMIRVTTQGTMPAHGLCLDIECPPELQPLAINGSGKEVSEKTVRMPAFDVPAGEARTFRLKLRALASGDARMKIALTGPDLDSPVVEEESTTVYAVQPADETVAGAIE